MEESMNVENGVSQMMQKKVEEYMQKNLDFDKARITEREIDGVIEEGLAYAEVGFDDNTYGKLYDNIYKNIENTHKDVNIDESDVGDERIVVDEESEINFVDVEQEKKLKFINQRIIHDLSTSDIEIPTKLFSYYVSSENIKETSYLLFQFPHLVHVTDKNGWYPIHEAARGSHLFIMRILIDTGADVNVRTDFGAGQTPIWWAMKEYRRLFNSVSFKRSHQRA